jgi:hypothetical protein
MIDQEVSNQNWPLDKLRGMTIILPESAFRVETCYIVIAAERDRFALLAIGWPARELYSLNCLICQAHAAQIDCSWKVIDGLHWCYKYHLQDKGQ